MSYVAIKGGERAIERAEALLELLRTRGASSGEVPIPIAAMANQLHFLHGQVLSEGGLYDPELASLAIKQSLGDPLEAAFYLRAYRSSRQRLMSTGALDTSRMRLIRRISSAFKEVPGGQMLGPSPDFGQRLFNLELLEETPAAFNAAFKDRLGQVMAGVGVSRGEGGASGVGAITVPKVIDALREQGLVAPLAGVVKGEEAEPFDVTREPIMFPLPRSAWLALMSRGERGTLLGIAYSSMRGYGDIHPTVAELRVGYLPVELPHPVTGELVEVGEVLITECEIVAMFEDQDVRVENQGADLRSGKGGVTKLDAEGTRGAAALPTFSLGYGCCFGHNEVKAISMAILDRNMQNGRKYGAKYPAEDEEFVLSHCDGIDSMGFCIHWKMPHYVTFQSDLDRLRNAQDKRRAEAVAGAGVAVAGVAGGVGR